MEAVLTIRMRKQHGLLSQIIALLNRQGFHVHQQKLSDTDMQDQSHLTLYVTGAHNGLGKLTTELKAFKDVIAVKATPNTEMQQRFDATTTSTIALNQIFANSPSFLTNPTYLGVELPAYLETIIEEFYQPETHSFAYAAFAASASKTTHRTRLVEALTHFEPATLSSHSTQLAFWLNVHNVLALHGVVAHGIEKSLLDVKDFFKATKYVVGGYSLSLDDIAQGILRSNARKFWKLGLSFYRSDPRRKLVLQRLDPRIHFALFSACSSSPPLCAYYPANLNEQLQEATQTMFAWHLKINKGDFSLEVPKLFSWYKKDFGSHKDIVHFIAAHIEDRQSKTFLQENVSRLSLNFIEFDWSLNGTNHPAHA